MDLLEASIRIGTPLLLAALGGLLSERAGVFAVGLEGMMLAGAFTAILTASESGNAAGGMVLGSIAAMAGGAAIGLLVALVAVRGRADTMVTGLSVNIVAIGATSTLQHLISQAHAASLRVVPMQAWALPGLDRLPVLGPLFAQPPLTWLALLICAALTLFLRHTQSGLTLRATGEDPTTVFATGSDPMRIRMTSVIACGAIAGLGGAVLVLQQVGSFTDTMTGGRGYLALASLIVGRWSPFGTALACLVFGGAQAIELQLEAAGIGANPYLLQMTPYLIALAVLAVVGRSASLPAAIGRPLGHGETR